MSEGPTRRLAEFCEGLTFEDLSPKIVHVVKHRSVDYLGVALYGSTLPSSKIVIEVVRNFSGTPESTIIGVGDKVPSPNAALANGSMSHGLELDDVHKESSMHPGAAVIPAALAIAEREGVSGKMLVTSITLGYEVMARIGMALTPAGHYGRGFHPTATCGVFGATIAAGKILGLNADQLASAMGIAGSQAAGLMEFLSDGSWTKRLHPGWAAHGGVIAALLAHEGYTGPKTVLEGKQGFIRAYSDNYDLAKLTDGLGKEWAVMNTSVKRHACCYYKQSAIDAVLKLVEEHSVRAEEVEEITIGLVKVAIPIVAEPREIKYNVRSIVDAQFSMPYGTAVALLRHRAFVDEYTEDMIKEPRILNLMRKIKIIHDPELDKDYPRSWPAKARIKAKDGGMYESRVDFPKGDQRNPFTDKELQERFRILAGKTLSDGKVNEIVGKIWRLEKISDLKELMDEVFDYF